MCIRDRGKTIQFKDLSERRLNALTRHMVKKLEYGTNQINKIQRRLNTVVKSASANGHKVHKAFFDGKWRVKVSKLNDNGIALTEEELQKIKDLDIEGKLDRVRDRFIIGVNTGQRYSDFKTISVEDVIEVGGKKYLNILQEKGTKVVQIPINDSCLLYTSPSPRDRG